MGMRSMKRRYYVSITAEIDETSRYNNDLEASPSRVDGIGVDSVLITAITSAMAGF